MNGDIHLSSLNALLEPRPSNATQPCLVLTSTLNDRINQTIKVLVLSTITLQIYINNNKISYSVMLGKQLQLGNFHSGVNYNFYTVCNFCVF